MISDFGQIFVAWCHLGRENCFGHEPKPAAALN
jgi:hypothetical protein